MQVDTTIRDPANNGDTSAEILLELRVVQPGPELDRRLFATTTRIRAALAALAEIRAYGVEHAPPQWREQYQAQDAAPLVDRLWLMGFEVNRTLEVAATFDCGDLDMLVVHLDPAGRGRGAEVRP